MLGFSMLVFTDCMLSSNVEMKEEFSCYLKSVT